MSPAGRHFCTRLCASIARYVSSVLSFIGAVAFGVTLSGIASAHANSVNVAAQANGGVASASTTLDPRFPPSGVNDGDRKGLNWANGGAEYIVTFDADGQHRIDDALSVLAELQSGTCDVVYGSRFLGTTAVNMPAMRRRLLKLAAWVSNWLTGTRLTDAHNGLRAP